MRRELLFLAAGGLLYLAFRQANASIPAMLPGFFSSEGDVEAAPSVADSISDMTSQLTGGQAMQLSQDGLNAIARRESFSPNAYRDAGGWSIGYGHYMGLTPTMQVVTPEQGMALLLQDSGNAVAAVNSAVTVPLTQSQFDALVSLAYNIGSSAFKNSTLVRLLNSGDYAGAQQQFGVWIRSQGSVNNALVARRQEEAAQFAA